jgi:SOS response associated peptidase (SRAP)
VTGGQSDNRSFAIVTTTPNELCARLHNRMPVVLKPEAWPVWLGEKPADASALKALLAPLPSEEMVELTSAGDRGFESSFLQQPVHCEPDFLDRLACGRAELIVGFPYRSFRSTTRRKQQDPAGLTRNSLHDD